MLGAFSSPHRRLSDANYVPDERLAEVAKSLLRCIPPARPIDVFKETLLREEFVALASIDHWAIAGLSKDEDLLLQRVNDDELVALLNGIDCPDLPFISRLHDSPLLGISKSLKRKEAHNLSAPHLHPSNPYPDEDSASMTSMTESVQSIQSAAGPIVSLTSNRARPKKKSKLRVCRLTGGIEDAVESMMTGKELHAEQVIAVREALDSGDLGQHSSAVFDIVGKWNEVDQHEIVIAFCLAGLSLHFEKTDSTTLLTFDLNNYLLAILNSVKSLGVTSLFELKHCLLSLSCIFSKGIVADNVLSSYLAVSLDLMKNKEIKKSIFLFLKNLTVSCFNTTSDSAKKAILLDIMDSIYPDFKLTVEIVFELLVSIGGKEKLQIQSDLVSSLADFLWSQACDQKIVGEKRDFVYGVIIEIASVINFQSKYPSLTICEHLVPLCVKSLGKDSPVDVLTRCRMIDLISKVIYTLLLPINDNDKDAAWIDLFEAWSHGQPSYMKTVEESILFRNHSKLITFLISLCSHEAVNIRLKSIRAIVNNSNAVSFEAIMDCLSLRLDDASPAVRDCVLDVFLKDFNFKQYPNSLILTICSMLNVLSICSN